MSEISGRIKQLNSKQRAELLKLLNISKQVSNKNIILKQAMPGMSLPLSLAQKRLWFLQQLEGPNSTYNMPSVLRLKGQLNFSYLNNAIQLIINRHDIMRTQFLEKDGIPIQIILPVCKIDIVHRQINEADLFAVAREEAEKPFDLTKIPLIRVNLLTLGYEDYALLINIHHIIADGWSLGILIREFCHVYHRQLLNLEEDLPSLPVQYADYALWQQEQLAQNVLIKQINYWRQQLADLPHALKLPTNKQRPAALSYYGNSLDFIIEGEQLQQLYGICRQYNVTLYILLLAVFKVLLFRYSGQNDLVVGSPIANRKQREIEPLIGFFVNTLVLRSQLTSELKFSEFLIMLKDVVLKAYDNQDITFDHLVEILQPERNLNKMPLCQVEFGLHNVPVENFNLPNLNISHLPMATTRAKFDMTVALHEQAGQLNGTWEYSTELFEEASIVRMIQHYKNLLKNLIENPDERITAVDILSSHERRQLLIEWNQSLHHYVLDKSVVEMFSEQVQKTPDKIAVIQQQQRLSYKDLDRKVNRLANYLKILGASYEARIALYLERGIDYLTAMLATMKACAAFVPVDPNSALSRNIEMLEHCDPLIIITHAKDYAQINHLASNVICLDNIDLSAYANSSISEKPSLHNLAYIIYTSGSTGKPKGVMIEHKGMINHLLAKIYDLNINAEDIIAQIAVQTFDVSIWQFLCALLVGGSTLILTGEEAWEPEPLLKALMHHQVTIVESVPSHTHILLDEMLNNPHEYSFSSLRYYISNAEPMPTEQCTRWFSCNPHISLVNTYGTTECSDDTTHLHIHNDETIFNMPYVPTRNVLPNMKIYILDEMLNPVPIGVCGEVYIGGAGVGRGYFKDQQRTEYAFIANPYSVDKYDRLYRTGDLARYYADGTIEFVGRNDFQLKIRGFRVETGEVEAVLQQHPAVAKTLVTPWQDSQGVKHLVCYLITKIHPAPLAAEFLEYAKTYLPAYMVPNYFILLDEFPLSANGKIDRKRLPEPREQMHIINNNFVKPQTDLEQKLATLWADVLQLKQVGLTDNFFQIGGHSLIAVELVNKMKIILGEALTLKSLFEAPTIASLLQLIKK